MRSGCAPRTIGAGSFYASFEVWRVTWWRGFGVILVTFLRMELSATGWRARKCALKMRKGALLHSKARVLLRKAREKCALGLKVRAVIYSRVRLVRAGLWAPGLCATQVWWRTGIARLCAQKEVFLARTIAQAIWGAWRSARWRLMECCVKGDIFGGMLLFWGVFWRDCEFFHKV